MPPHRRAIAHTFVAASLAVMPSMVNACARPSPPPGPSLAGLPASTLDGYYDFDATRMQTATASLPPDDTSIGDAQLAENTASSAPDAANATKPAGSPCVIGKVPPARMSDAQLFGEVKSCIRLEPQGRGVALLTEAQRRLRGRRIEETELTERIGNPNGGNRTDDIPRSTKGQFTQQTADSVLVYEAYQWPNFWQFWFAAKNGRIVGAGMWPAPVE